MNDVLKEIKDSWDQLSDSAWYRSLRTDGKIAELMEDPASAFHPGIHAMLNSCFPDWKGKRVLLPSSGDNHAAFAFARMGAEVTSTDISERQLEYAREIADRLELPIRFACEDTMELSGMGDEAYDLVYTSNGTHTWIMDVKRMYQNISRVLKPGGFSVMYDIHPFNRLFTGEPWKSPQIQKPYGEIMPHCHWRVQDLVNAMAEAGLSIRKMEELQAVNASFWFSYDELQRQDAAKLEGINDWTQNPMAALPAWIAITAQK